MNSKHIHMNYNMAAMAAAALVGGYSDASAWLILATALSGIDLKMERG